MTDQKVPQSPEEYPADVRQDLQQHDVSHEGDKREAGTSEEMSPHLGAVEDETSLVTPPMEGPSKLTEGSDNDLGIDPHEEISGG